VKLECLAVLWYAGRWWRDHLAISLVAQCEHDRIGAGGTHADRHGAY
jgi:hypothetical protein